MRNANALNTYGSLWSELRLTEMGFLKGYTPLDDTQVVY